MNLHLGLDVLSQNGRLVSFVYSVNYQSLSIVLDTGTLSEKNVLLWKSLYKIEFKDFQTDGEYGVQRYAAVGLSNSYAGGWEGITLSSKVHIYHTKDIKLKL